MGEGGGGELSPFCASIFPLFRNKCLILGLIDLELGVGGGGGVRHKFVPPIILTSVKFHGFEELYLC